MSAGACASGRSVYASRSRSQAWSPRATANGLARLPLTRPMRGVKDKQFIVFGAYTLAIACDQLV